MKPVDEVIEQLRASGERITLSRRWVLEALCAADDHRSIQDLQQYIREQDPGAAFSDTTVYRVLQWLKDLEIVCQTDMGQAGIVYALISEPHHHHLICLTCGATITVPDDLFDNLRQQLSRQYGFAARIDHMAIYGQCQRCAGH